MGRPRSNTSTSTTSFSVSRFGTERRERLRSLAPDLVWARVLSLEGFDKALPFRRDTRAHWSSVRPTWANQTTRDAAGRSVATRRTTQCAPPLSSAEAAEGFEGPLRCDPCASRDRPRVCTMFAETTSKPLNPHNDGPQRSSLFASWSNHMANSVNCVPETRSSATRTIVAVVISLPQKIREAATTRPRRKPTTVIRIPST